ncbi:MAG TPA: hypothetical protein VL651_00995 [Bacteroidia bacterium]|jgi:hypothetical protein|nr:hypothetical protein [Bacteroidia bacterium]
MELYIRQNYLDDHAEDFFHRLRELNLVCYASDAANEMEFENASEFEEAVKRAMELCIHAGIPIDGNFRRVYTCSESVITYDWKLSVLAYVSCA